MKIFNKYLAFTLAEILITLGVIGVIAAITIPTVVKHYQERVTVNKVKKFYSMMSQAYLLSVKDNGYANEWNVGNGLNSTTASQIANYIKPYLRIIKDCNINSGCLNYKTNPKYLNGSNVTYNYDTVHIYYKIITADGSYIWWRGTNSYCITTEGNVSNVCSVIFFDINGNKDPNTAGKDIFVVYITPLGLKTGDSCAYNNNGFGCLGFILKNNNMNYPLNE